jgi:hypothetical protein
MEFRNQTDVTANWVSYVAQEARSLSALDDTQINSYADRQINNPEVQAYLKSQQGDAELLKAGKAQSGHLALGADAEGLSLHWPDWLKNLFGGLKAKIKKIFCATVKGIQAGKLEDIIKAVLLALIPAFASGLPAVVLPIVISLTALLLKNGYAKVCPA